MNRADTLAAAGKVIKTKQAKKFMHGKGNQITENPLLICKCRSKNSRMLSFSCMAKCNLLLLKSNLSGTATCVKFKLYFTLDLLLKKTVKGLTCDPLMTRHQN